MSQTRADCVTVNIDNMLNTLSSAPSKPSMFRVSDHLRSINPEAYNPEIIAIGPFHSDKKNLQNMELHKVSKVASGKKKRVECRKIRCHYKTDLPEVPIHGHYLLGIVYDIECSSFAKILSHLQSGNTDDVANINSAVELKEAGISFKKSKDNSSFHIEFNKKAMIIPEWEIFDSTESLFRNLMAYEYYLTGSPQKYVTDYVFFMHCLVHSPEDAKLLRRCGIINNFLGAMKCFFT
ncbi:Hypothetical predicted protein [Olea europaea subsp. europaea]|uniref:Uncharacterized protein n=1 Tax=Olea europaea subsp. europaea TaxID=158383 RepID=A0A8S0T3G9_OLEEU|nr:Hypothetical predicted protein [Olea europaea subsp. europaea]